MNLPPRALPAPPPTAQDHGLLGCAAVQHRHSAGPALDRGRRPQRHFIHQPVGSRRHFLLRARRAGHQRAFVALSARGRPVRLGARCLRAVPRIHRRMDVLDLHRLLLPRPACWPAHPCPLTSLAHRARAGAGSRVSDLGFAWSAACRGGAQHHRPQHRQMAAERRRRGHLFAAAYSCRSGRSCVWQSTDR